MSIKDVIKELRRKRVKYIPYTTRAVAALSWTPVLGSNQEYSLKQLEVTFSSAPTTAENFTVTKSGTLPATRLFTQDPSNPAATSIVQIWEEDGYKMERGTSVTIAYTNTDARQIFVKLLIAVEG